MEFLSDLNLLRVPYLRRGQRRRGFFMVRRPAKQPSRRAWPAPYIRSDQAGYSCSHFSALS